MVRQHLSTDETEAALQRGRSSAATSNVGGDQRTRSKPTTNNESTKSGDPTLCPECDGQLCQNDNDTEIVCADCGIVIPDATLDTSITLYTPSGEADGDSRVGPPTTNLLHDKGLSTEIGWKDVDANGNNLSGERKEQFSRLRKWDKRSRQQSATDRNLMHALGEIDRMAAALGVPDCTRETASVIYRQALDDRLLPGRAVESVASASLYAASRMNGIPRSINEIATVSRVKQLRVERAYRHISRELGLKISPTDPSAFIGRLASDVDCKPATEQRARQLVKAARKEGVHSGKHPVGIAAGALYAAARLCDEQIRQVDISRAADVSEVTIRNRYPEILAAADCDDWT